jgi:hypothetical protein
MIEGKKPYAEPENSRASPGGNRASFTYNWVNIGINTWT